ncbi:unnamed protein product [Oikopleura dioica]|uniref:Uncharacterized protein n=1 Tax=Oikopleura dioica TaxID=34765 RepID=E4YR07_OIKDI|nr:unnamed protein product [Oikopleura dioica]
MNRLFSMFFYLTIAYFIGRRKCSSLVLIFQHNRKPRIFQFA